ncbi:class I SAM-dependent methyltransferase [Roseibium sp.]|uniref:class I SAM-dependent methyltransferase n=1 Tax=Roseibium sp. TaxID=1936156 RepID=UPI003B50493E
MTDWTDGYLTDIGYTHGFYRELTPLMMSFAALSQGIRTPSQNHEMCYCELGCGQGLSTNILAAANPHIAFHATDFNPSHIASAQRLARDSGTKNVHFYDTSFDQFRHQAGLPEAFDIISLHGIYSWVNKENRSHIVEFIRNKLKPGGIVYISYNTLPGFGSVMPLRQLMVDHADQSSGLISNRIDAALAFADELKEIGAQYFKDYPLAGGRLEKIKDQSRKYLAHEYFNRDWTPFYFKEVADELSVAKLTFVASAYLPDHVGLMNLTAEQRSFLARETDPIRIQSLRDIIVNQQFRRDIFGKGVERFTLSESLGAWLESMFVLVQPRKDVSLKIDTRLGEVKLQEEIYDPILDAFSNGPLSTRDLMKVESIQNIALPNLQQALTILVGFGILEPCFSKSKNTQKAASVSAFNRAVMQRAAGSSDISYMASPITGGGIHVTRFEQLFLAARLKGNKSPEDWAKYVWAVLATQGQKLKKDGKTLESEEENLSELVSKAREFQEKKLPVLISLQVA